MMGEGGHTRDWSRPGGRGSRIVILRYRCIIDAYWQMNNTLSLHVNTIIRTM